MFCHGNGIWRLDETDANLIERPTAPGGATGGGRSCSHSPLRGRSPLTPSARPASSVEYEAGNYLVSVHAP